MADSAMEVLTRALSGHGINEKAMIETLGNWDHEEKKLFRKKSNHFFTEDERSFERWQEHGMRLLKHEFVRFKNAVLLWTTHPWERDARLVKEALSKGNHNQNINILIEVACTRTSDELLGARKAYHSLFDHSIEEDVASHIHGPERKLLVAFMSAYRYEGPKYKEDTAKSEAKKLAQLIKEASTNKLSNLIEDDEVVRILSTRSKHFLHSLYKHYKEISAGRSIEEDLHGEVRLQEAVLCLANPVKYFTRILDVSLKVDADKKIKKVLTRIVVTRADRDMKEIKIEFKNQFGVSLAEKIESVCNGSYKDFLLTLLARSD